jgi:Ca2+-binding RTX toxin-like protein
MRQFVCVAFGVAALTFTPSAFAGTASVDSAGRVLYVAPAGEANHVIVVEDPAGARIVDLGAPIVPATGCAAVSANEVVCTAGGGEFFVRLMVAVNDLNDFVLAGAAFAGSLRGQDGDDVLKTAGFSQIDAVVLIGGEGNDMLEGSRGFDDLRGGLGDDELRGGGDTDLADYSERSAAVRVDLDGVADDGELGEADTLMGIEQVGGGAGDDVLIGTDRFNVLFGGAGADTIRGLAGFDIVEGGAGADRLNAGGGGGELVGGGGDDTLTGGAGFDLVTGAQVPIGSAAGPAPMRCRVGPAPTR